MPAPTHFTAVVVDHERQQPASVRDFPMADLAGDLLLEPARRVAVAYVVPGLGGKTRIRLATHGIRAGVLGAALLAAHELEGPGIPSTAEVQS